MIPIVTPEEMAAIDAAAPEPVEVLVERAGAAVARATTRLLGGTYGRGVNVVAGKGNNGADGRAAALRLTARGVAVRTFEARDAPPALPPSDLVIDAAYGTGFKGTWTAPDVGATPVLAVDLPSGVDGWTGEARGRPLRATRTVTFAALKPGLLFGDGPPLAGEIEVADIGLDTSGATAHLVEATDIRSWLPARPRNSHKWVAAVRMVAGSPGMTGSAHLAAAAAQRAGSGMVTLSSPGIEADAPLEVVQKLLPETEWSKLVLDGIDRFHALVVGPGLGRAEATVEAVRELVAAAERPVVVDGDGLFSLSAGDGAAAALEARTAPTVLTPHDGEFKLLTGRPPDADRLAACRRLAAELGCVVLLKGSTTVVADASGRALLSNTGDARLATAGTGDVLSGIIGALLATGVPALEAAVAGAWIHGRAAQLGPPVGLVASDLLTTLPTVMESLA